MEKKVSNKPQNIDEKTWYYEHATKIEVIRQVYDISGKYLGTEQFDIPWRKLKASLKRKEPSFTSY